MPCGATLAAKCKPCAENGAGGCASNRSARAGTSTDEPTVRPDKPGEDVLALVRVRAHLEFEREAIQYQPMTPDERTAQVAEIDAAIAELDEALGETSLRGHLTPKDRDERPRRKRSTRRRQDAPDLPRLPVDPRTVGRAYSGKAGKTYRPSMLLTLTLGSHGPVHSHLRRGAYVAPCECGNGTARMTTCSAHPSTRPPTTTGAQPGTRPLRPAPRPVLAEPPPRRRLERPVRRLRRAATPPRPARPLRHPGHHPARLLKQVAAATYHQVWWPSVDASWSTASTGRPVWDDDAAGYVDPDTREPLPTWDGGPRRARRRPGRRPAHVARFGRRSTPGASMPGTARRRTLHRLRHEVRHQGPTADCHSADHRPADGSTSTGSGTRNCRARPAPDRCANWLLYGVQPEGARPSSSPGRCKGKVHQRDTLGFGGRRVLVSRDWSGKTLADHRADDRAWVRAILAGGMAGTANTTRPPTTRTGRSGTRFELARPEDPDVPTAGTPTPARRYRHASAGAQTSTPPGYEQRPPAATTDPTRRARGRSLGGATA